MAKKSTRLTPEAEWDMTNRAILAIADRKYKIDKELDKLDIQRDKLLSQEKALMDERKSPSKKESSLVAKRQRDAEVLGISI